MENTLILKSLRLCEWRQFVDVHIELHPRLTILAGPNGSGKSTILSVLGHSLTDDVQSAFLATPVQDDENSQSSFSIGTLFERFNLFPKKREQKSSDTFSIGKLQYSDGAYGDITIPNKGSLLYELRLSPRTIIPGFRINSHAALPAYQEVSHVPISGILPRDAFIYYRDVQRQFDEGRTYLTNTGKRITNPVAPLKEILIAFAMLGSSTRHVRARPELVGLFEEFQTKLRSTLPVEIGFKYLEVRRPEIVVVSSTGEFPIDGASGGLMALIQITWQIFLFTKAHAGNVVVLIDEPENHLHPTLQRDFLGKLLVAFPAVQFIVATHSPFIVSSVRDSDIYALSYQRVPGTETHEEAAAVVASKMDVQDRASPASEILATVMGVSVTIPIWAEARLTEIVADFGRKELSQTSIHELKERLQEAGLGSFLPEAIAKLPR